MYFQENYLVHMFSRQKDRSSKSIPTFTFVLSDLRNVGWNNPGQLLLEILSSKLQLCGPNSVTCTCSIQHDIMGQVLIMSDKRSLVGRALRVQSLALCICIVATMHCVAMVQQYSGPYQGMVHNAKIRLAIGSSHHNNYYYYS